VPYGVSLASSTRSFCVQAIERLVAGRTVLIIAHRLSTVQAADQIVVLDAGRVAEVCHPTMRFLVYLPPGF